MTKKEKNIKLAEWYPYKEHESDNFDIQFQIKVINGTEYILDKIPEIGGLHGQYFGQGDLQWAWVRLDVWKKWVRPEILKEFLKICR